MEQEIKFIQIASIDEFVDGERLFLEIDGTPIVIFSSSGEYIALCDEVGRKNSSIREKLLDGEEIECPNYGTKFNVHNGKVTQLPDIKDISSYPIRIVDGQLEIGFPKRR